MYSYKFTKQVEKFLSKQDKNFLLNLYKKLDILVIDPFNNRLDIKPLKWIENNYRLRIWKIRLLYLIKGRELKIYFYKAWNRWDIYK